MKKTLAILLASAALTTVIGLPALAAFSTSDGLDGLSGRIKLGHEHSESTVMHVANSDDDYGEHGYAHDDEDNNYGHEDDDCDDDSRGYDDDASMSCGAGNNPAPAGTTAPPQNGLFANGASPTVQVN